MLVVIVKLYCVQQSICVNVKDVELFESLLQ